MKKLELKHLAPYLPYGLKYQLKGNFPIKKGEENIIEDIREIKPFDFTLRKVLEWETCKPILRPLSDLEKKQSSGKSILDKLADIDPFGAFHLKYNSIKLDDIPTTDYRIIQVLFEGHFDVFGLIPAGLAIDINTLKK